MRRREFIATPRRTTTIKRRKKPTAVRRRVSSAADLQKQLDQRTRELAEALEQQKATVGSPQSDQQLAGRAGAGFRATLENAIRVCDAKFGTLFRYDGEVLHPAAAIGTPPRLAEFQKRRGPFRPQPGTLHDRVLQTRQVAHSADYAAEPHPGYCGQVRGCAVNRGRAHAQG